MSSEEIMSWLFGAGDAIIASNNQKDCRILAHSAYMPIIIEERFTVADLYGRLANLYADIPRDALRQTGVFKVLTGGDMLSAEKKFKEPFSFENTAKLIFSANVLSHTLDDTDAFFRRWLIITFPNKFEGERCDPEILEKLTTPEELSGFLNLVLATAKREEEERK